MSRREREFTPAEALALTMREASTHWYGSPPLIVGVRSPEGAYPQPLDPAIGSGIRVFFFTSATGVEFSRARTTYAKWVKRYHPLGVEFVLAFRGTYPYFMERPTVEAWLAEMKFGTPATFDRDGDLAAAFGAGDEPAVAILQAGKVVAMESGAAGMAVAETAIQARLRDDAPGLSLWPVFTETGPFPRTLAEWSIRSDSPWLSDGQIRLIGEWEVENDRATTADAKAEIHFTAPSAAVAIVARSLGGALDPTRIRFDADGAAFSDTFAGEDFGVDSDGNSSLVIADPRAYFALKGLTAPLRSLRFRFLNAAVNPVAVYGFTFGE